MHEFSWRWILRWFTSSCMKTGREFAFQMHENVRLCLGGFYISSMFSVKQIELWTGSPLITSN